MGDKLAAKALAARGRRADAARLGRVPTPAEIGYPLLVKAARAAAARACGSCARRASCPRRWPRRREAAGGFGDDRVFLERYLRARAPRRDPDPRRHARQRRLLRRARVLDPAPPPEDRRGVALAAPSTTRCARGMGDAALRPRRALGYVGAGTVEFLVDDGRRVLLPRGEHAPAGRASRHRGGDRPRPGARQLRSPRASRCDAASTTCRGHAIEVRLYAEDPSTDFLPATGTLAAFAPAEPAVRWDSGVAAGSGRADFDPMLAKVIAHAPTRREAAGRLALALERTCTARSRTATSSWRCCASGVRRRRLHTGFIERTRATPGDRRCRHRRCRCGARSRRTASCARVLGSIPTGWRNNPAVDQLVDLVHGGWRLRVRYRLGRVGI